MVGCRSRINDIRGILETLVEGWIPQETVAAFENGQHRLATARSVTAEHGADAVLGQKLVSELGELFAVRFGIINDRHEFPVVYAAFGVDFLDRKHRPAKLSFLDDGRAARLGEQHADTPGLMHGLRSSHANLPKARFAHQRLKAAQPLVIIRLTLFLLVGKHFIELNDG